MATYLDLTGLTTFWGKAKEWIETKLSAKADTTHTHSDYSKNGHKHPYSDITDPPAAYSLPTASATQKGGVMIGSGVNVDAATGKISVTNASIGAAAAGHTHAIATATAAGFVKPVSVIEKPALPAPTTAAEKYYPVQMSSDGAMFVNVPWTDTNTTYDLAPYLKTATAESTYVKKNDMVAITKSEIEALFNA